MPLPGLYLPEPAIKEALSKAYVHAVAAKAGFGVDPVPEDFDSVDLEIKAGKKLVPESKMAPKLALQLKATAMELPEAPTFSFQLKAKNYNDLCEDACFPRLLIVYVMPLDEQHWVTHEETGLLAQRCAYWCNLHGLPKLPESQGSKSVTIRRCNVFSPDALRKIMIKASLREAIGDVLS